MLKEHGHQIFCHDQFVDTQHNFEIIYLHLNYTGCRSSHERCSIKKLLIKISQYSQKNTCVGVFFKKRDSNTGVFLWTFFRTPILKNICERLCWNFSPTRFAICNLHISFAILQQHNLGLGNTSFILSFYMQTFKTISVYESTARLNFCQLLHIRPIFKTLILRSIFPFCSICQSFDHIFFYITVCYFTYSL